MYDYLTELHQISTENSEEQQQQQQQQQQQEINLPDGSITIIHSPYDNQQEKSIHEEQTQQQRRTSRSLLSCGCSRTISGDNIHQTKTRSRQHHRICSIS